MMNPPNLQTGPDFDAVFDWISHTPLFPAEEAHPPPPATQFPKVTEEVVTTTTHHHRKRLSTPEPRSNPGHSPPRRSEETTEVYPHHTTPLVPERTTQHYHYQRQTESEDDNIVIGVAGRTQQGPIPISSSHLAHAQHAQPPVNLPPSPHRDGTTVIPVPSTPPPTHATVDQPSYSRTPPPTAMTYNNGGTHVTSEEIEIVQLEHYPSQDEPPPEQVRLSRPLTLAHTFNTDSSSEVTTTTVMTKKKRRRSYSASQRREHQQQAKAKREKHRSFRRASVGGDPLDGCTFRPSISRRAQRINNQEPVENRMLRAADATKHRLQQMITEAELRELTAVTQPKTNGRQPVSFASNKQKVEERLLDYGKVIEQRREQRQFLKYVVDTHRDTGEPIHQPVINEKSKELKRQPTKVLFDWAVEKKARLKEISKKHGDTQEAETHNPQINPKSQEIVRNINRNDSVVDRLLQAGEEGRERLEQARRNLAAQVDLETTPAIAMQTEHILEVSRVRGGEKQAKRIHERLFEDAQQQFEKKTKLTQGVEESFEHAVDPFTGTRIFSPQITRLSHELAEQRYATGETVEDRLIRLGNEQRERQIEAERKEREEERKNTAKGHVLPQSAALVELLEERTRLNTEERLLSPAGTLKAINASSNHHHSNQTHHNSLLQHGDEFVDFKPNIDRKSREIDRVINPGKAGIDSRVQAIYRRHTEAYQKRMRLKQELEEKKKEQLNRERERLVATARIHSTLYNENKDSQTKEDQQHLSFIERNALWRQSMKNKKDRSMQEYNEELMAHCPFRPNASNRKRRHSYSGKSGGSSVDAALSYTKLTKCEMERQRQTLSLHYEYSGHQTSRAASVSPSKMRVHQPAPAVRVLLSSPEKIRVTKSTHVHPPETPPRRSPLPEDMDANCDISIASQRASPVRVISVGRPLPPSPSGRLYCGGGGVSTPPPFPSPTHRPLPSITPTPPPNTQEGAIRQELNMIHQQKIEEEAARQAHQHFSLMEDNIEAGSTRHYSPTPPTAFINGTPIASPPRSRLEAAALLFHQYATSGHHTPPPMRYTPPPMRAQSPPIIAQSPTRLLQDPMSPTSLLSTTGHSMSTLYHQSSHHSQQQEMVDCQVSKISSSMGVDCNTSTEHQASIERTSSGTTMIVGTVSNHQSGNNSIYSLPLNIPSPLSTTIPGANVPPQRLPSPPPPVVLVVPSPPPPALLRPVSPPRRDLHSFGPLLGPPTFSVRDFEANTAMAGSRPSNSPTKLYQPLPSLTATTVYGSSHAPPSFEHHTGITMVGSPPVTPPRASPPRYHMREDEYEADAELVHLQSPQQVQCQSPPEGRRTPTPSKATSAIVDTTKGSGPPSPQRLLKEQLQQHLVQATTTTINMNARKQRVQQQQQNHEAKENETAQKSHTITEAKDEGGPHFRHSTLTTPSPPLPSSSSTTSAASSSSSSSSVSIRESHPQQQSDQSVTISTSTRYSDPVVTDTIHGNNRHTTTTRETVTETIKIPQLYANQTEAAQTSVKGPTAQQYYLETKCATGSSTQGNIITETLTPILTSSSTDVLLHKTTSSISGTSLCGPDSNNTNITSTAIDTAAHATSGTGGSGSASGVVSTNEVYTKKREALISQIMQAQIALEELTWQQQNQHNTRQPSLNDPTSGESLPSPKAISGGAPRIEQMPSPVPQLAATSPARHVPLVVDLAAKSDDEEERILAEAVIAIAQENHRKQQRVIGSMDKIRQQLGFGTHIGSDSEEQETSEHDIHRVAVQQARRHHRHAMTP